MEEIQPVGALPLFPGGGESRYRQMVSVSAGSDEASSDGSSGIWQTGSVASAVVDS